MKCPECKKRNTTGAEYCIFCQAEFPPETEKNNGKAKKVVAIICCVVIVAAAVLGLVFRSYLTLAVAKYQIYSGGYSVAASILENNDTPEGKALAAYSELREQINAQYPALLENYDSQTLTAWRDTANKLAAQDVVNDSVISAQIHALSLKLTYLCSADDNYNRIKASVLDMMDAFSEYNRLHTKTGDTNVDFVPSEEYKKLDVWQSELSLLIKYASTLPDYDNVYLLSYVIKEAQGELVALREDMDAVVASGYNVNDTVRYSDDTRNSFPYIQNQGGVSLSLYEKEVYEEYLRIGIRKHLVTSQLASYYISA